MKKYLQSLGLLGLCVGLLLVGNLGDHAVVKSGTVPNLVGPIEPSQTLGTENTVIGSLNNHFGALAAQGTPFSLAANTTEQIAAQFTIPPAIFPIGLTQSATLHQKCWGTRANNADVVTARVYFGAEVASLTVTASAATNWSIDAWTSVASVTSSASTNQTLFQAINTAVAATLTEATGVDNVFSGAVVAKCSVQSSVAAAGDAVVNGYLAEIIN